MRWMNIRDFLSHLNVHRAALMLFVLFLCTGMQARFSRAADYLGVEGCAPCHAAIHVAWQKTRHARAMDDLVREQKQDNVTCIPCHSTGYGEAMGFLDMTATPELASVQCEACHGPAKTHAAEPEKVKTALRKPGPETCRRCHTAEQDSVFDYENMSKKVH